MSRANGAENGMMRGAAVVRGPRIASAAFMPDSAAPPESDPNPDSANAGKGHAAISSAVPHESRAQAFSPAYLPGLDGIRTCAVLCVCAMHARVPGAEGGWVGVDMFFVLSGYLISTILANELSARGSVSVGAFYLRRARRLYPPLLAMLLCYAVLAPLAWPSYPYAEVAKAVVSGLAYVTNYALAWHDGPRYVFHLWSLAVEVHFYIVWALLLPAILRSGRPVRTLMLLYVAATAIRFLAVAMQGEAAFHTSHSRMSGLVLGSLLAVALYRRSPSATLLRWIGYAGLLIVIGVLALRHGIRPSSIREAVLLAEIGTAGLIVWALTGPRFLTHPLMTRLGLYSYGLYLWHYPIMRWLRPDHAWWVTLAVGLGVGLAAAALSYHTLEAWFRRARPGARIA